ncbi:MAG: FtsH protease activity modulator HflK [Planctomycetota bacterium]|jgi:membrane protease subunit HflK
MALDPPPRPGFRQPFDPIDWAARSPGRVFTLAWIAVGVILLVWGVFTAFYTVDANEQAVVLRFGKFHLITEPGFHWKLPYGFDKALKEEVKTVHSAEFGYRTIRAGRESQFNYKSHLDEATMLTGDLNLAVVNWEVRYKIRDLKDYLFEVRDPVETLRDVSQAVMRTEVGDRSVDEVLTLDRITIENEVLRKMQEQLDGYRCGLQIVKMNLKGLDAPEAVRSAFQAVEQAEQSKKRIINEAEGQRNKEIPVARGSAERKIKEAEGYKIGRLNRAEGAASAFLAVLAEYRKAEEVTRRRLYLEAMLEILPKIGEIVLVDSESGDVLKLLDVGRGGGR